MAQITLRGDAINTNGELPQVGSQAPDFVLTTGDLADVTLETYAGKKKLLNIVPSLDTPTCQLSTKKFNDAAKQHDDAVFLTVSADLPFAQGRFCQAENFQIQIFFAVLIPNLILQMFLPKFCRLLFSSNKLYSFQLPFGLFKKSKRQQPVCTNCSFPL